MLEKSTNKKQYGDFQTPIELARKVVRVVRQNHNIVPDVIIEPTCGKGTFLVASHEVFKNAKIIGFEINVQYINEAVSTLKSIFATDNIVIQEANFFDINWQEIFSKLHGYVLVIGNPPWVTNSELSTLRSKNFPKKSNFQNRKGIDAITGASNFDISEWMLLQQVIWLSKREGAIAFLCKYAIARKVIRQIRQNITYHFSSYIYLIDAKSYFNVSVAACLFVFITNGRGTDCEIYKSLDATQPFCVIGERDGFTVSNVIHYEKWQHLKGQEPRYIWHSGIKHDCKKVMELEPVIGGLKNGLGEVVDLEDNYLYPLLKSSDIGNGQSTTYRKVILVTQKTVGENTSNIKKIAPKTWNYLLKHRELLNKRRSSVYKNKPDFSVFGVGPYSFKDWKIAISGFYKRLRFNLVGPLDKKPVAFDDTINFLSFDTEEEAKFVCYLITSNPSLEFLESMIFWDEKRPITIEILKRLSFKEIARELNELEQYKHFIEIEPHNFVRQLELQLTN